jgi:CRISPR-associated protein Cas1
MVAAKEALMDEFSPSDLKTILHSKRANLYFIEHCRILVNGGRVEYITDQGKSALYWNIPIANTTFILLGTGTSITQEAMRELAKAGVMVGFCGGGGTPLFAANEVEMEVSWLCPQSEYRPVEHLQRWMSFWFFKDEKRLEAAKRFQLVRLQQIEQRWTKREDSFLIDERYLTTRLNESRSKVRECHSNTELLTEEARLTKELYRLAVQAVDYGEFTRAHRGGGADMANRFLDHGNYLAYGLGATAAWVLGLPHGVAVLHGKTRRGGLVFDIADLIKDALVLPQAFLSAKQGDSEQDFRQRCVQIFQHNEVLDLMIDTVKEIASDLSEMRA